MAKLSPETKKVLGVFAKGHTFFDETEEALAAKKLPLYLESAPTYAEMISFALRFFRAKNKNFALIAEEEGSDNFGNEMNASGMLESVWRADQALGIVMRDIQQHKDTLLVVASDSNAGGPQVFPLEDLDELRKFSPEKRAHAPLLDGRYGSNSLGFLSAPDRSGRRHPFAIAWASSYDMYGSVIAKAHGYRSELLPMHAFNTDLYELMRAVLFGEEPKFSKLYFD